MRRVAQLVVVTTIAGFMSGGEPAVLAAGQRVASSGQRQTLMHNGIRRGYVVRAPADAARRSERLPLVLVLHGGGGNAANAEAMTGFTDKARREGFIVVYPEGTSRGVLGLLTWNAGHCCGYAMENRVNDVAFVSALLDKLARDYPVDPRRIYATGMSNGGMMTHRLGIELSDRFAAIAPVVATLFGDEVQPKHPVSALFINGMLDKSVPPDGGAPGGRFDGAWDGTPAKPALEQAAYWARADACSADPVRDDKGPFVVWRHRCGGGKAVELYLVKDNGHAWPGGQPGSARGDKPSAALNATDVIWDFFKAQTR